TASVLPELMLSIQVSIRLSEEFKIQVCFSPCSLHSTSLPLHFYQRRGTLLARRQDRVAILAIADGLALFAWTKVNHCNWLFPDAVEIPFRFSGQNDLVCRLLLEKKNNHSMRRDVVARNQPADEIRYDELSDETMQHDARGREVSV